ncbi:hypothetical protein VNO77_16571 [Canavalia gladiata]|uniref:Uncharacterized protein n=1 Tax=Canavalia gladiata TaxID=3824 RepID=A0AAN9M4C5_CANGL
MELGKFGVRQCSPWLLQLAVSTLLFTWKVDGLRRGTGDIVDVYGGDGGWADSMGLLQGLEKRDRLNPSWQIRKIFRSFKLGLTQVSFRYCNGFYNLLPLPRYSYRLVQLDLLLKLAKVADHLYSHYLTSNRRVDFGVDIIHNDFDDLKFSNYAKVSSFNYTNAGNIANYLKLQEVDSIHLPISVNFIFIGFEGKGNHEFKLLGEEIEHWSTKIDHIFEHTRIRPEEVLTAFYKTSMDKMQWNHLPVVSHINYNFSVHAIQMGEKVASIYERAINVLGRKDDPVDSRTIVTKFARLSSEPHFGSCVLHFAILICCKNAGNGSPNVVQQGKGGISGRMEFACRGIPMLKSVFIIAERVTALVVECTHEMQSSISMELINTKYCGFWNLKCGWSKNKSLQMKLLQEEGIQENSLALRKIQRPLYVKHPKIKFALTRTEDTDIFYCIALPSLPLAAECPIAL